MSALKAESTGHPNKKKGQQDENHHGAKNDPLRPSGALTDLTGIMIAL